MATLCTLRKPHPTSLPPLVLTGGSGFIAAILRENEIVLASPLHKRPELQLEGAHDGGVL